MPFDATERVRLGRTVLEVTRLGFGAAPIGGLYEAVAESDARATVERAWEYGNRRAVEARRFDVT